MSLKLWTAAVAIQVKGRRMLEVKEMFGARWEVFVEVACGPLPLPQQHLP
jgi:hypothetical protein